MIHIPQGTIKIRDTHLVVDGSDTDRNHRHYNVMVGWNEAQNMFEITGQAAMWKTHEFDWIKGVELDEIDESSISIVKISEAIWKRSVPTRVAKGPYSLLKYRKPMTYYANNIIVIDENGTESQLRWS